MREIPVKGRFSVVIPSRSTSNLVACVRAIREAGETARIIVVDDEMARDGPVIDAYTLMTCDWVNGIKPFVFARNINIGIQAAGEDDVILLNDDALLKTPGGFSKLAHVSAANQEYGCIGAVTNLTGEPLQHPCGKGLRIVPHIAFVCVFISRSSLQRFGLLDERYPGSWEDRDYCEAITRAGLKVGALDDCFVDHSSLTSSFRGPDGAGYKFADGQRIFQTKWGKIR